MNNRMVLGNKHYPPPPKKKYTVYKFDSILDRVQRQTCTYVVPGGGSYTENYARNYNCPL